LNSQLIRSHRTDVNIDPNSHAGDAGAPCHVVILAAHNSAENREEIARRLVDEATFGVELLVAIPDEESVQTDFR
jgi:hypothetical protein